MQTRQKLGIIVVLTLAVAWASMLFSSHSSDAHRHPSDPAQWGVALRNDPEKAIHIDEELPPADWNWVDGDGMLGPNCIIGLRCAEFEVHTQWGCDSVRFTAEVLDDNDHVVGTAYGAAVAVRPGRPQVGYIRFDEPVGERLRVTRVICK